MNFTVVDQLDSVVKSLADSIGKPEGKVHHFTLSFMF